MGGGLDELWFHPDDVRMTHFGNVMWERRLAKGLTFRELDKLTGISAKQLENLENGHATNPRLETLVAIARALGPEIVVAAFQEFGLETGAWNDSDRPTARYLSWNYTARYGAPVAAIG